jgi:hypothetical protein
MAEQTTVVSTGTVDVNKNTAVIDTKAGENQTVNTDGDQSQANDDFLKTDPDKTGVVKKTAEEMEKLIEINKKLQSNYDKLKADETRIETELKKEREKTLTQKQLEELKQHELEQNLKAKEQELITKELQFNKSKMLHERGWDLDFMDIVSGGDLESFEENCKKLQSKLDKFIEKKVNERISGGNPVPGNSTKTNEDVFTIEEIQTLPGKMGQAWTNANLDKLKKSITYHSKK